MYRRNKVKCEWTSNFAWVIGIFTSDGNLSSDGRHLNITSKDEEIVLNVKKCLNLSNTIGRKARGYTTEKKYFVLQFGDKTFYEFLLKIGLMPAKSKIVSEIRVPDKYFPDFLRGCIDGDGNVSISKHPESKFPQLRIRLVSASKVFIYWIKDKIKQYSKCSGGWVYRTPKNMYVLSFGKRDSIEIIRFMYYKGAKVYLKRKYSLCKPYIGRVA